MIKLLLLIPMILLMCSGCTPTDQEVNDKLVQMVKTNAEVTKICKEVGKDVQENVNGYFFCKP